jgi:hypothetical protein
MNTSMTEERWRATAIRRIAAFWLMWCSLLMAGCVTLGVADFDQSSLDRSTALSRSILGAYQELLSTPRDKREALVEGDFDKRCNDITTSLRVHLLLEQTRPRNAESAAIVKDLLATWEKYAGKHKKHAEPDHLGDATLLIERALLTRLLTAALVAEQAKKPGSGGAQALTESAAANAHGSP